MTPKTSEPSRTHRSTEVRVAELEQKIAAIKARAVSKEAKANPVGKALLLAVKAIEKAQAVAAEAKNEPLGRALEASRAPLSAQLVELGIRPREPRAKRGGRRKKGEAA